VFSFLFLASTITLIGQGNLGPAAIGFLMFLGSFALAQRIQAPMSEIRGRVKALMNLHLPICPICKSSKGYNIKGFWPWSQYIECENCKAKWASNDFSDYKNLKTLRVQAPPTDPYIFARFVSNSPLKIGKNYSVDLWKLMMQNQRIELPTKERRVIIRNIISSHQKKVVLLSISLFFVGIGYFLIPFNYIISCLFLSIGISLFTSLFGFYFMPISKDNSYILFITSFIALFIGLMTTWETLIKFFNFMM